VAFVAASVITTATVFAVAGESGGQI